GGERAEPAQEEEPGQAHRRVPVAGDGSVRRQGGRLDWRGL
ncbi:MAG: hypothetical protein AVDCRST_MAG27-602, partial [uncultured Craurococcus sp.]